MRLAFSLLIVLLSTTLPSSTRAGDLEEGKEIYEARCVYCHGESGHGDGPAGKVLKPPPGSFAAPGYWDNADTEKLKDIIRQGKAGTAMVPFGQTLGAGEIEAVLAYLRTFGAPE